MENKEIERKWDMDAFPALAMESEEVQVQGYLSFEPATVRIRKVLLSGGGKESARYYLTIKGKGTIERTEVELPLDEKQFEALWPLLAAPGASKRLRRYRLPDGHQLECSVVDEGEAGAFYYAEVEFESEAAAAAFVVPSYLGTERTHESGFSMAAYCRRKMLR